jgi:hypothetical protein
MPKWTRILIASRIADREPSARQMTTRRAAKSSRNLRWFLLPGILLLAFCTESQQSVPLGTIIPVRLNHTLSSRNAKTNDAISARVMQDVPLPGGRKIREGTKVTGHVIEVRPASQGSGILLSFTFDRVLVSKKGLQIATDLRAIASALAVDGAYLPELGMGEGEAWNARTTDQVGGDIVYWGGGSVESESGPVGKPVEGADSGVLVKIRANSRGQCRGETDGNHEAQALWVFSSDACGVYDIHGLTIAHSGRTQPFGVIRLNSESGEVEVRGGSGLLLRVIDRVETGASPLVPHESLIG